VNTPRAVPADAFRLVRRLTPSTGGLIVFAMFGVACSDQSESATRLSAPLPISLSTPVPVRTESGASHRNVSVQWNEVARSLVASHNANGPMASRVYALVSVAQYASVLAVDDDERHHDARGARGERRVAIDAAIARASANVLTGLFPDAASAAVIANALQDDARLPDDDAAPHGGTGAGDALGADVAQAVLARAASDGAAGANCPATPPLPASQFWHDDANPPNPQPQLPCFGNVRTWLDLDVKQFRADPPPPFGSPAFLAGLAEVRQISDTRTAAQLAIVDAWLDGANTFTPPGHWNLIASDLITQNHLGARVAARIFAVLNIAMMDTHVACWDRKFWFWESRPWMVDPLITTPRGQPHHPANPSGHACAGGAGSGALAGFFRMKRDSLFALGDEQGFSTVLSGVHFRFDVDKGLEMGRAIAARALSVRDLRQLLETAIGR
jgi:membrane-associated phospholipid phosphatase